MSEAGAQCSPLDAAGAALIDEDEIAFFTQRGETPREEQREIGGALAGSAGERQHRIRKRRGPGRARR